METKKVLDQVRTLKYEFQALSGKKPNDVVNGFKVKYVNQTLTDANAVLGEDKPYKILICSAMKSCQPTATF